jgi:hypothetical protein
MEAMMFGMGDLSQFAPPAPQAPMGPGGLPIGGNLPSSDPAMDPAMDGSSLFRALNMQLDPMASPPEGHGVLDPPPDLNSLLAILAFQHAGVQPMDASPMPMPGMPGRLNSSGVFNEPTHPGESVGLNPFNVLQ